MDSWFPLSIPTVNAVAVAKIISSSNDHLHLKAISKTFDWPFFLFGMAHHRDRGGRRKVQKKKKTKQKRM